MVAMKIDNENCEDLLRCVGLDLVPTSHDFRLPRFRSLSITFLEGQNV